MQSDPICAYPAGERVHLKSDPSQFGTVERAPSGALFDRETRTQLVFWEHKNADICSSIKIADLLSEEELHERRLLFFRIMCRDDMRLLRGALAFLRDDQGVNWRGIQSLKIRPFADNGLMTCHFFTERHFIEFSGFGYSCWPAHWVGAECCCQNCS